MSKQVGIIKLDGAIGGIAFYESGGQHLARVAKGPSKEQIATQPNFIRTRENNSEFGGSAHSAKSMRTALAGSVATMGDPRITSRLTKTFREICAHDLTGIRGQRQVSLSTNTALLQGFEFNKAQSFDAVFSAPFTHTHTATREEGDIDVPSFLPASYIHAPAGATHFRLIEAIGVVSDFIYDTALGAYEPTDPTLNTMSAVDATPIMPLAAATVGYTLKAVLPGTPSMTTTVSVVQCLGIEFYQHVGAADYLLAQGNAMKVVEVF